ncbi:MAG: tetratricopeptide repeat protein [Candidatus Villigracilaceae bacterium]
MLPLPVILLLEGLSFVVLFGVVSLLKREGLSRRFAIEAVILTLLVSGATVLANVQTHPVLFLIILYLFTMRVRLLVDVGNIFAARAQFDLADKFYALAANLWPDETNRLILKVNQAASLLQRQELDEAIAALSEVIQQAKTGYLGVKYEAAAHYNLGVAYLRKNMMARAIIAFNAAIDTWPASEYARRAETALKKQRLKHQSTTSKGDG